jgi:hypothetical protein
MSEVQELLTRPQILTVNRANIKIMEYFTLMAVYLEIFPQETSCKSSKPERQAAVLILTSTIYKVKCGVSGF